MDVGQEDLSQVFALASIWILIFAFGSSACLLPAIYTFSLAYQDSFSTISYTTQASSLGFLSTVNGVLLMALGSVIGYPVASAAGNSYKLTAMLHITRSLIKWLPEKILCFISLKLDIATLFFLLILVEFFMSFKLNKQNEN